MKVTFSQGTNGRYRWNLYEDDGAHAGVMTVRGVATYDECVASAKRAFGNSVELVLSSGDPDMDWPLFAGERDWAD